MENGMIEEPTRYEDEATYYESLNCDGCEELERDCTCPVHCDGCGRMVKRGGPCGCLDRDEHDEQAGF